MLYRIFCAISLRSIPRLLILSRGECAKDGFRKEREETMGFLELFVLAVGLSMDAFAVSVC
ncbi:MAG: hypothetical protein K2N41_06075, partial [Lachnospiraceae bacterium]|nr:hypothetical protein [Lachnospiraceae bacterium]